jgi:peptidoglycan/LPS O-acetylase OafA/YrhL
MRWLVWIGSISYGLCLWHPIIYASIGGLGFYDLTSVAVGTPLSVLVAALFILCHGKTNTKNLKIASPIQRLSIASGRELPFRTRCHEDPFEQHIAHDR